MPFMYFALYLHWQRYFEILPIYLLFLLLYLLKNINTNYFKGHVECWDPRSRTRVGQVDVATNNLGLERFNLH